MNSREKLKKLLKFFLGFPLTIISFVFITRFIFENFNNVYPFIKNINPFPLVIGVFLLAIFFLLRSLSWSKLHDMEGYRIDKTESIYLYSIAELGRYVPGNITAFVSRIKYFRDTIPTRKMIKLIFYEGIIYVTSSAVISIPAFIFLFRKSPYPQILLATLFLALILLALATYGSSRLRNNARIIIHNILAFKDAVLLMMLGWIFFGLGNLLIGSSLHYLDANQTVALSSLFVLSWLIGYIVLVAPLGLGVREAAVTYGLSFFLSVPIAATIAILGRLALMSSELLFLFISFIFYKFVKFKVVFNRYSLVLWVSITSYVAYFTYYSFEKHANFFTGRFDLGNMDQTIWNTLHGRIFELTNPDGTDTISRLAIHADFILVLLSPLYIIWEDPRTLLFIQTLILGIGAYFIYKIADYILKSKNLSTILAISYLLNPFIQKQNLFDFHAVALSTTFLLAAFYFTLVKNYKFFFLFLIFAVLTKENVYLTAAIFGLYLTFSTKNKKWLFLTLASLFIFYVLVSKLIPWARGGQHFAAEYFGEFGDTPPEILSNLILNPLKTISSFLTQSNLAYLYKLFLPVGFLSIFSPFVLFFAAPDLAINMLSENENLRNLTFHYGATIIPFIYIASILGLKRILDFRLKFITPKLASYFIIAFSILSTWQYGVLPGSKNPSLEVYNNTTAERHKINQFLEIIPEDLSVASTNNLGAHLSHRQDLYTIPQGLYRADVVVLLLNDKYASPSLSTQIEYARDLSYNPEYIELARFGDFIAFAKRNAAGKIRTRD